MKLKIVFNKKAMETLAKELRRASWGVAISAAAGGIKLDNALVLLTGGIAWVVLQISASVLESVQSDKGGSK